MDFSGYLLTTLPIFAVALTIYRANQAAALGERTDRLLDALISVVIVTNIVYSLLVLSEALMPSGTDIDREIGSAPTVVNLTEGALYAMMAGATSFAAWSVWRYDPARQLLRRYLPDKTRYDPYSLVHTTAIVLSLMLLSLTVGEYIVGGGTEGLAQGLASEGISLADLILNQVLWIFAACLGVGFWLRRTVQAGLQRLGLRFPSMQDVNWGIGVGLGLVAFRFAFTLVWLSLTTPEQFDAQTAASAQVAASFSTIPSALLLSALVAIGEEIFFRGAVLPVFGNVLTSVFFIMLHSQYILSPATIPLFIASLVLGWLRIRYSTNASIVGHFVFNFTQLALSILAGG